MVTFVCTLPTLPHSCVLVTTGYNPRDLYNFLFCTLCIQYHDYDDPRHHHHECRMPMK